MSTHQIRLYNLFRKELHLSDDKASEFVTAVDDVVGSENNSTIKPLSAKIDGLEKRFDILEIRFDGMEKRFDTLEAKVDIIKGDIHSLENGIKGDIHSLEKGIKGDIHSLENRLTNRMYWVGIGQFIAIIASAIAIVKFMR
jgi:hypothetical protein